jgi:RHS repeat-associated protein
VRKLLSLALLVLFAHGARAQSRPFAITSVVTQVFPSDGDAYTRPGQIRFRVENVSSQTQTLVSSGDCGSFLPADDEGFGATCAHVPTPTTFSLAAGALVEVTIYVRLIWDDYSVDPVTVSVWPSGNPSLTSQASALVTWSSSSNTLTAQLMEATFTPLVAPHAQALPSATYGSGTLHGNVRNVGTAPATYTLSVACTSAVATCSVSPATMTVAAGTAGDVVPYTVTYTTREASGSLVTVTARAQPRQSGVVDSDSAVFTVSVADLNAPTIALSPSGDFDQETNTFAPVGVTTRGVVTANVCDTDGNLGAVSMTMNGAAVALETVNMVSDPSCHQAARATFRPLLAAGHNTIVVTVGDGVHTTSVSQDFVYDDRLDHLPQIVAARTNPQVGVNQTVADTFFVTNPGWHAVSYTVAGVCSYAQTTNTCPAVTLSPATVSVAPGARAAVVATYRGSNVMGGSTLVQVTATLAGGGGRTAQLTAITAPIIPPTIVIAPANGTVVTTPTVDLTVTVCDTDDPAGLASVTWQGQALSSPTENNSTTGCQALTWRRVAIAPWQQVMTATATDAAGHVVTQSATITYAAPLSAFAPLLSPKGGTHRVRAAVAVLDTFTVTNNGTYSAAYQFVPTCGMQGGCTATPGSTALGAGSSAPVVVGYQSFSTTDSPDSLRLIAKYTSPLGSTIADTAKRAVVVPSVEVAPTVAAYNTNITPLIPSYYTTTSYRVTNRSSVQVTYALRWAVTGMYSFPEWGIPDSAITVEPGQSRDIIVSLRAPPVEGVSGTITLSASYDAATGQTLGASATTYWVTRAYRIAIAVFPSLPTVTAFEGAATHEAGFRVVSNGSYPVSTTNTVRCEGMATNCRLDPGGLSLDAGETKGVIVSYDVVPGGTSGKITVIARSITDAGVADSNSTDVHPSGKYIAFAVIPKAVTRTVSPNRTFNQRFYVTNVGDTAAAPNLAVYCDAPLACGTPQPSTLLLNAGQRDSATVSITTSTDSTATRTARLVATGSVPNYASDTGSVAITTASVADIVVSVRDASPGPITVREQCLTIAAGPGAAYECGDLRLAQSLPATTTMNHARMPTLTYVSRHAAGVALFPVDVSIAAGNSVSSITARVTIDGRAPAETTFAWNNDWNTNQPRRIVVSVNTAALQVATGAYHYTLSVTANSPASTIAQQDTGTVAIIDRSQSPFGAGWWLDGLEQLVPVDSAHKLWIGGDGSTRLYTRVIDSTWIVRPSLDRPDTLIVGSLAAYRRLRNGAFVQFDNLGRHRATVNARGERTQFNYDGASAWLLTSIDLPVPVGSSASQTAHRYNFTYGLTAGNHSYLTQIAAPPSPQFARIVTVEHAFASALVTGFAGPDTTRVGFDFANGDRISGRTDRRGFRTAFEYDDRSRTLTASATDMRGTGDNSRVTFCAAEAASTIACASGPMALGDIASRYNGPRTDVQDTMRVDVTRFGAPRRITDALGSTTTIERSDATWPLLPTAVIRPNGFTTRVVYNRRGLVDRQTDEKPFAPTLLDDAVTTFTWDDASAFDLLMSTTSPTGQIARFGYFDTGDRRWQEDGRGVMSRAWFSYTAGRQLASIQSPGNLPSQVDAFEYDPIFGNLFRSTSPDSVVTSYHVDAIGRVDTVFSPISAGVQRKQAMTFDAMDRVVEQRDIGPAIPYIIGDVSGIAPAVTLVVNTMYDPEGNVDSTRRASVPDLAGQGALTLRWTYDGLGRRLTSTDTYGKMDSVRYDPAGNVLRSVSRRHLAVTSTYDVLNRVRTHTTDAATYDPQVMGFGADVASKVRFPHFAPGFAYDIQANPGAMPPTLVIPGATSTFDYDAAGNLVRADNTDAQIRRAYYANGALRADTLRVAIVDPAETPVADKFGFHSYALGYTYDIGGRRTLRVDDVPGCSGCIQAYAYDSITGALSATIDREATFSFVYDAAGRVTLRSASAAGVTPITETMSYDPGSRLIDRIVAGGIYHDVLTYDDAGRVIGTTIGSTLPGVADATQQVYNGLGAVAAMRRERGGAAPLDQYTTDAFGNTVQRKQWLGNSGITSSHSYGGDRLVGITQAPLNWSIAQGAPAMQQLDQSSTDFDLAGNSIRGHSSRSTFEVSELAAGFVPRVAGNEWTFNAYSADEKLAVAQRTFMVTEAIPRTVFVEHRYDALGRRVLTRTRWDQYCEPSTTSDDCLSTIDHTAWDGDQVLMEYRNVASARVFEAHPNCLPDSDVNSEDCRDHFSPHWSQDGLGAALETEWSGGNFAGAVRYTHAGGLDEPLAIWKTGFTVGIIPHRSWRGMYEAGSFLGQSSENIAWPGRDRDAFMAPDARFTPTAPPKSHWLGSIVEGKSDPSGLMYMRNRYYDPKSGRFTQEDPIGLGGGMNLYGFGGGDAVNFSDPFGLCPPEWMCKLIGANAGQASSEYWASVAGNSSGIKAAGANVAGALASLWTKETYGKTIGAFSAAGRLADAFEGIYEFPQESGELYVGQSSDVPGRLDTHIRTGKLDPGTTVGVQPVAGGKTAREIAEQRRINEHGGIQNLANKLNPIGPKRQHLMTDPPG